jgi:hypothetical protein
MTADNFISLDFSLVFDEDFAERDNGCSKVGFSNIFDSLDMSIG